MKTISPLTVLFDANPLMTQKTGVGHFTAGLVAAIAEADPDARLIGYYYNLLGRKQPPAGPKAPNISYRPIYHLPGPAVNLLRRFGLEVPVEILAGKRADFILYPNFLGQPSLFGTPSAPVIHDLMYHDHPEWGSDKNIRDLNRFVPRTLRRASFVVTMSRSTTERLSEVYDIAPDRVLTTFIPPVAANTISDAKADKLVKKLGIRKAYLLFVGTLEPRKNLVNLMEAYALLPDDLRQQYGLVLAGKMDWKYQETKDRLETLKLQGHDIHYAGYVDDDTRAALYQRARLMVLAAHYEGFGMQLLESMQYGVAPAVSDIPVFHEVGGDLAAYFDQRDPVAIAKTLTECLRQPAPRPEQLRRYVASQPDWQQVGRSVAERIRQAVEQVDNGTGRGKGTS